VKPESLLVDVSGDTGRVALHVRTWRRPADTGLPVLLVHGLASNARLWDGVARHTVGAGHPTYAVDLRSHGESPATDSGFDTATAAGDLDAVCAALSLDRVVVAGQSWGGNVVVQFAARFPARVEALVLVDGGWIDLRRQFASWEACVAKLRPPEIDGTPVERIRRSIADGHPDWQDWAVDATVANLRVDADGKVHRRLSVPHHLEIVRSMWDDPPSRYYASIAAPTALVPAGQRGWDADHPARAAAEAIADVIVRISDGADHDVHAQRPDLVAATIVALAKKARSRP
jgi:pimeloyl-ACP methyl ester carboxylesterase